MALQRPKQSCCEDMPPKKKNAIPDRWTDYTAVGKRIPGTRFIAFKVPLKQSFRYHLTQSEAFGPLDLVRILEKEGQQLGLIIDLTYTTRYYKVEDLPNTLYHLKIFTAGHEVPNDATILSFKKAVRHFLHDNENNDKLIGVHCTHGLNRTGYLICRYLIDVEGMNPQKAINLFNESRGYSIERQNYLDDLRTGCLAQGHLSRGIEGGRERCTFSPPHLQSLPVRDSNPQPLGYESNSLTIRPLTITTFCDGYLLLGHFIQQM
uniref:RNA/RNP complex-1-interacting phosphatase n=1 Tax=Sinocyclocheilus grahami TaxID=75366 RepID=A0A672JYW4_SINGR